MFKIFGGLVLIMIGGMLLYYSIIGRVASYFAEEVSPAIETASEAAGAGISRGINRGGGIKLDINTHSRSHGSSSGKEIIKIKCRKCGYLDTEDAEFCSKCGKRL